MPNFWIIFLTGLTTGGLSCLAVQGGLLANVVAGQAEEDSETEGQKPEINLSHLTKGELINYYATHGPKSKSKTFRSDITLSIILFLVAKIAAYTLLGFLLGWLGTMIQLTPLARGILMLFVALFMLGTALRMFNVHPIFNFFQIQPPKFIRTYIRRLSKNSKEDYATPIFLGALTVLIPCGVTQVMMALAIGTGEPVYGALIMLSFTLGASPLFFFLAYTATRLGEKLNTNFVRVIAITIIIFALISLESGLNLVGSPVSYAAIRQSFASGSAPIAQLETPVVTPSPVPDLPSSDTPAPKTLKQEQKLSINATNSGYSPNVLRAKNGIVTKLTLVTQDTTACTRGFVITSLGIQKVLPETGSETIEIPAQESGILRFSCSMGMYTGQILFD